MSTITMPEPKKKTKNKKQNNTSEKKMSMWDFDKIDGFFGGIPFHTLSNEINFQKEITSRKTYLGYEDNDHRYIKANTLTLDIVFFGKMAKMKANALESYWKNKDRHILILLKRNRIFNNVVIKDISITEELQKDGNNTIEMSVSFQEMRYGIPGGNLYDEVNNTTKSDNMYTQIVGIAKEKLNNFVNMYSRAIK